MVPDGRVLVTGASSGIGCALAKRFARDGHPLVLVGRDVARLQAVAAECGSSPGGPPRLVPADLARPGAAAALLATPRGEGLEIGSLVNCAGFGG